MKWVFVLLLAPTALALDAIPDAVWGPRDGAIVVRATGWLFVNATPPILVENRTTPARLDLPPDSAWHGLVGAVELKLHRDTPQAIEIRVEDDASGALFEWPADAREVPLPWTPAALAAAGLAAWAKSFPRAAHSRQRDD